MAFLDKFASKICNFFNFLCKIPKFQFIKCYFNVVYNKTYSFSLHCWKNWSLNFYTQAVLYFETRFHQLILANFIDLTHFCVAKGLNFNTQKVLFWNSVQFLRKTSFYCKNCHFCHFYSLTLVKTGPLWNTADFRDRS